MKNFNSLFPFKFSKKLTLKNAWKAISVLLVGLCATLLATIHIYNDHEDQYRHDFEIECNGLKNKISERLSSYAQILQSCSSFLSLDEAATRNDWKLFIQNSNFHKNIGGNKGIGYNVIIPENNLQNHIQQIQEEGLFDYEIKPAGNRDIYTSIVYIEPLNENNLKAIGYDTYTDSVRKKAMDLARDLNRPELTSMLKLIQEDENEEESGIIMFSPIYKKNFPVNTIEERRTAITGWVSCPFNMNDFMQSIIYSWNVDHKNKIDIKVFKESDAGTSLLFDSKYKYSFNQRDSVNRRMLLPFEFHGTKWLLDFYLTDKEIDSFQENVLIVLFGGILMSFLMFNLSLSLFNSSYKEHQIVEKLYSELLDSENKFKTLFENFADAIFIADAKTGIIIDANKTASSWTGKDKQKLIGLHQTELHPIEQTDISINTFTKHVDQDPTSPSLLENILLTPKNKENIPVEISAAKIKINNIDYLVGIYRDISKRKAAYKKLNEKELYLESVFRSSPVGIGVVSNRIFTEVNDRLCEMLGYTKEELVGNNAIMVYPSKEDYEKVGRDKYQQIEAGGSGTVETKFKHKNGRILNILLSSTPMNKLESLTENVTFTATDFTERKNAELALINNERLLSRIINLSPSIMIVLDKNRSVININNNGLRLIGEDRKKIIGERIGNAVACLGSLEHPNGCGFGSLCESCKINAAYNNTIETGNSNYKIESPLTIKNDQIVTNYTVLVSTVVLNEKEILVVFDDITERKKLENELISNKSLLDSMFEGAPFIIALINEAGDVIKINKAGIEGVNYEYINGTCSKIGPIINCIGLSSAVEEKEYCSGCIIKESYEHTFKTHLSINKKEADIVVLSNERKLNKTFLVSTDYLVNEDLVLITLVDISERKNMDRRILQATINAEEKERKRFAMELHDGLGPILSNVQLYYQWLAEEDENKEFVMNKGLSSLKLAFETLREISSNLSPHILQNFGLTVALENFIEQIVQKETKIIFESACKIQRFGSAVEHTLYRAIIELLNNSIKYAKAKRIKIELNCNEQFVYVKYSDNGIGFDREKTTKGFGLLNIKHRVNTLKGHVFFTSKPGKGFQVDIECPYEINE